MLMNILAFIGYVVAGRWVLLKLHEEIAARGSPFVPNALWLAAMIVYLLFGMAWFSAGVFGW